MTRWTEATLRAAASWQSFKAGQTFFTSGAVVEATAAQSGWTGALKIANRTLRVNVTMKSATDFETRCACPENQRTGEICGHAVAVGLAVLAGGISTTQTPAPPPAPIVTARPRAISLPPNWHASLARGKIAATLTVAHASAISPADLQLSAWLAQEGLADSETLHLHLDGTRGIAFLEAIAGHPAVTSAISKCRSELPRASVFVSPPPTSNRISSN
jgi:hypothetical protein